MLIPLNVKGSITIGTPTYYEGLKRLKFLEIPIKRLSLTGYKVCTISNRPIAKHVGHNSERKKQGSVT